MNRIIQSLALVACAGLLLGILLVLGGVGRNGIRIELAGEVNVAGMHDTITFSVSELVPLVMKEPAHLVTTGADGKAVPASISLLPCPECGGAMLPIRWSPWTFARGSSGCSTTPRRARILPCAPRHTPSC